METEHRLTAVELLVAALLATLTPEQVAAIGAVIGPAIGDTPTDDAHAVINHSRDLRARL